MNNYFIHSQAQGEKKSIISIPGWAERLLEAPGGDVTTAYAASAWAMRSVQVRADAVAEARVRLVDAEGEEIETHPALDVLEYVNEDFNRADFWRYSESSYCVYGAAYWEIVRNGTRPIKLYPLNAGATRPIVTAQGVSGYELISTGKKLARQDVIYFRGVYDPRSDLTGKSPLGFALAAALGLKNADEYMSAFFANGAIPALVLTTPQPLSDSALQTVVAWWNKLFKGAGNQHKTGFVGNDLKPMQVGTNPKDLALADVRKEMRREISTALGVPELIITAAEAADQTPTEMAFRIFYQTTIASRWRMYADTLNAEFLPEWPDLLKRRARFEFDTSDIDAMQDAEDAKAARLKGLVDSGIITPQVAALELGYAEEDVPQDEGGTLRVKDEGGRMKAEDLCVDDVDWEKWDRAGQLNQWRAKALAAVREGKAVPIESGLSAAIEEELLTATTAGQVRAAFERHWKGAVADNAPDDAERRKREKKLNADLEEYFARQVRRVTQRVKAEG